MIDRIMGYDDGMVIYTSDVYGGEYIGYETKDGEIILY